MNFSVYGNSDKKDLEFIASSIYFLDRHEYKIETLENDENQYFLRIDTQKIIETIVNIHITKDFLTASLNIYPGINVDKKISSIQIKNFVKGFGILDEFIEEDKISEAVALISENYILKDFPVAQGVLPVNGSKCIIECWFQYDYNAFTGSNSGYKNAPRNNSNFILAHEGDLLLKRIPPTEGQIGKNLRGEIIYPLPGENKQINALSGVKVNKDNTEYRAEYNGRVFFSGNNISVLPVFEIRGDVDLRVGDINFDGSVHVTGNVLPGFSINAQSIVVDGIVEKAALSAKDSIIIKIGRKGGQKGSIRAGNDINLGYCENGDIFSGGTVIFQKYCFNSLIAAEKIDASSKECIISGGFLRAFSEVRVFNLGSQSMKDMTISVGISPIIEEKAKKVMAEINNINASLQKISNIVKKIDIVSTDALQDPKFRKLIDTFSLFRRRLPLLQKKYDELMLKAKCDNPRIIVDNIIRSGVRIKISDAWMFIKNDMKKCEFFFDKSSGDIGVRKL